MITTAIDERGYRISSHIVQTASFERKPFRPEIDYRWREWEFAVEPGFDGVLVRRDNVHCSPDQCSLVRRQKLIGDENALIVSVYKKQCGGQHTDYKCGSHRAPHPPGTPGLSAVEIVSAAQRKPHLV